jgi:hypothetical protein
MVGHIFDIDTLISVNSQPWIVDKNNPNQPLIKISKTDYNLFKNGVYKKQGNKIEYNGKVYWLPNELFEKLKVIAKNKKIGMLDFAISLKEFLNEDIIEELDFTINWENISSLKNKNEDIYILCSNNTEKYYSKILENLMKKLKWEGIDIKKFYFINETFYNVNSDEIIFKKALINLQHLTGYEIQNQKFIDKEVTKYSKLNFYDNDFDTIKMTNEMNSYFRVVLSKSDIGLKQVIKEGLDYDKPEFIVNKITGNKYNNIITKSIKIDNSYLMKFENFKWK